MISRWIDRVKTLAGRFSVRTKIIGIVLMLTMVFGLVITWQVRSKMIAVTGEELRLHGESFASELAGELAGPAATRDLATATAILDRGVESHPDSVSAVLFDSGGQILARAVGEGATNSPLGPESGSGGSVHEFSTPVPGAVGGWVTAGMSDARLRREADDLTLQLLLMTLGVSAVGIAAATFLAWLLTRPIIDLVGTTRRVGRGDRDARATVWAEDEIGALADSFNLMIDEIEDSRKAYAVSEGIRARLLEQLIGAQEDERKRIARELHDGVGQSLSSMVLGLTLLERSDDMPATLRGQAVDIRRMSAETLDQVRRIGRELRPSVLDDLGLAAALERYVADFRIQHPGIETELHCQLPDRLEPAVETALYRVVQEAMTNVARHSGARTLGVLISERSGVIRTIIEDDGTGFDPEAERRNGESVGIHGMVERIEILAGRLDIESSSAGTTVYAEVPTRVTSSGAV